MIALGATSQHWSLVRLAYEFHIAPHLLAVESPRMLLTMHRYLEALNAEREKQRAKRR